jgi:hypothetical protein
MGDSRWITEKADTQPPELAAMGMATVLRDLGYDAFMTADGRITAHLNLEQATMLAVAAAALES